MILARRIALNGVQLDRVDDRILISGIDEAANRNQQNTVDRMYDGQRLTVNRRQSLDVNVSFRIRIPRAQMGARDAVLDAVIAWAQGGGTLRIMSKADKVLRNVICAQLPARGDLYKFDTEYKIVFRALTVPYWQSLEATTASKSRTRDGSMTLIAAGTAPSVLDFTAENVGSGTCNTMTIGTGSSNRMIFSSLGLEPGEVLTGDHSNGLLRLRITGTNGKTRSAMAKRTAASSDEIRIKPGANEISVTAGAACTFAVSSIGRYY